ncbi:MAG: GNAT family N-acetyltransferase [Chloroflexota bacterium]
MLSAIQAYLRKAASLDRIVEHVGPFLATISPDTDNPYMNYAIPDDGVTPTASDVEGLIALYESHKRTPRLEYSTELAPTVEAALLAGGFSVEMFSPLMVYPPGHVCNMPIPAGIELLLPQSDEEIQGMFAAQDEAYGGTPTQRDQSALEKHLTFLKDGGLSVLAWEISSGEPTGGGVCTMPFDHTTELAGIGVRPAFRRRGIAGAMTAWLAQKANAAGTRHVFLMAAGVDEARIYARAGFEQIGNMLHISRK